MVNLFARQIPTPAEAFFIIAIAIGIVAVLGYSDIVLHDFYVKPSISHCFPENQDEFCTNLRNLHDLPSDAQIDIGNKYWEVQKVQLYSVLLLLFFIKIAIVFGKPGHKERLKFSGLILFTAMVWGFSGAILFAFGGVDFFYYQLRPEVDIPDKLPWLNDLGIFQVLKAFGDDPQTVEANELIIGFLIGVGIINLIWLVLIYKMKKINRQMKNRGI